MKKFFAGTSLIWMATVFSVLLVLGTAVFVSLHMPERAEPVMAEARRKVPGVDAPSMKKEAAKPRGVPAVAAQRAEAGRGRPELRLDRLAGTLRVRLADTQPGGRMPLEHTCYRKNRSPAFSWSGAPAGTKSLVAILERRQAGKPPAWLWTLFDINPAAGSLAGGVPRAPELENGARHARNAYNKAEYVGPCEPKGQIPYAFRLFALDVPVDLPGGTSRDDLVRAMNGHIIDATDYGFVHYLRF